MNEIKKYTAADFARYHAGTMPAGEMHALEKDALEDPFLEDALEGYALAAAPAADVAGLRERISDAASAKKVFFLSPKAGWWRIAALLVIMAGAGYLFFTVNKHAGRDNNLAKNENAAQVNAVKDSVAAGFNARDTSADKAVQLNGNVSAAVTVTPLNVTIPPAGATTWTNTQAAPATNAYTTTQQAQQSELSSVVSSPLNATSAEESAAKYDFTQNAQSNQALNNISRSNNALNNNASGNNLGYSNIYNNGASKDQNGISTAPANIGAASDDRGKFKLNVAADSLVLAKNTSADYYKAKKAAPSDLPIEKRKADSDAVVATAQDIRRESKGLAASTTVTAAEVINIPAKKTVDKNSEVGLSGRTSLPSSGQTAAEKAAFDKYIKENMQPVYNQAGGRMAGEVLLSFIVKKGRPKNVKVAMSLCQPCEAQAIQLLENGPDWSGKKNEEKTVIIKF